MTDRPGRLLAGLAGLGLTALPLRRGRVSGPEVAAFRAVNHWPDALHPPLWFVMQLGAVGAVPATAAVAALAGRRRAGVRVAVSGAVTYYLAKGVKLAVRRGRPAEMLLDVRVRGAAAEGDGYLSGHSAVAVALAASGHAGLGRRQRAVLLAAAPVVGVARVYVGAHLPLDVLGGALFGWTVDTAVGHLLPVAPADHR